eukprot:2098013-Alexandrium_andersonii.AAC.1
MHIVGMAIKEHRLPLDAAEFKTRFGTDMSTVPELIVRVPNQANEREDTVFIAHPTTPARTAVFYLSLIHI